MEKIVVRGRYSTSELEELRARFEVCYVVGHGDFDPAIDAIAPGVRAVVTTGLAGLRDDQMGRLPELELIIVRTTGSENIDFVAAERRGIKVKAGYGVTGSSVADHAVALLLATIRDVPRCDSAARNENWAAFKAARPSRPLLFGKNVGIIGLGDIGGKIARRLAGFEVSITYCNRSPRPDVRYAYRSSAVELAELVDFLVVSCPGGAETHHLINGDVLRALGPKGILVNVGRGSVVDNDALARALTAGTIAGAALDVIEGEPCIPPGLATAPNLIITPHMGANSPEVDVLTHQCVMKDLLDHFCAAYNISD